MIRLRNAMSVLVALSPAPAAAYDWSTVVRVGSIEVSYMPISIPFNISTAAGNCAAGTLLTWNAKGSDLEERSQNAQAVLAALMTAQISGRTITIYGRNLGCTIDHIYIN